MTSPSGERSARSSPRSEWKPAFFESVPHNVPCELQTETENQPRSPSPKPTTCLWRRQLFACGEGSWPSAAVRSVCWRGSVEGSAW